MPEEMKPVLVRITTVPLSLRYLLRGQMRFMKSKGFEVFMISSDDPALITDIENYEGCRHFVISMTRKITPFADLASLRKMIRLLKKLKPDIVHTHTPKAGLIGMLAAKFAGVTVRLHTVAGIQWVHATGFKRWLLKRAEIITYKVARKIYPNSSRLKDFIIKEKLVNSEKVRLIGNGSSNGVDIIYYSSSPELKSEAEKLKEKYNIKDDTFVFCFIGRIVGDKGINELLIAFNQIYVDWPNTRLFLVGPLEEDLDPLTHTSEEIMKQNEAVIHTGLMEDVRPYLELSHTVVLPSYREGFPNVPLQAGCFRLPSIVSDINGCNEIIHNGLNGFLVKPGDPDELRDAMVQMLKEPGLVEKMGAQARLMVVDKYDQNHFWQELLAEYQEQLRLAT